MKRFRSAGRFARPHAGQDKTPPLGPLTAEEAPVSGDTPPRTETFSARNIRSIRIATAPQTRSDAPAIGGGIAGTTSDTPSAANLTLQTFRTLRPFRRKPLGRGHRIRRTHILSPTAGPAARTREGPSKKKTPETARESLSRNIRKLHPANIPDLATPRPQTPRPGPSHTTHAHPLSDGRPSSPHPRRPRLQKQRLRGGTRPTGAIRNYLRGLSGSRAITM